jgi:hypothetical protein
MNLPAINLEISLAQTRQQHIPLKTTILPSISLNITLRFNKNHRISHLIPKLSQTSRITVTKFKQIKFGNDQTSQSQRVVKE